MENAILLFKKIMQNCIILFMENNFAERLITLRKRIGLNQEELANEVEVSIDTVRRWEGGKQEPRLSELKRIAVALDTSITQLTEDETTSFKKTAKIEQEKVPKLHNKKSSNNEKIVIQQGNFRLEMPATPRGYAILEEKLKEVNISSVSPSVDVIVPN